MLSFRKLKKLLEHNNFIIISILMIDNTVIYIELLSIASADTFLLYIPSKYEIKITDDVQEQKYELVYVEIDELDKNPVNEPDNGQLESLYNEIDIENPKLSDNIEEKLEENYKKEITLVNTTQDTKICKDIYRQLNRLKFCTQSLKYKLGIKYSNFLCCIKRDDTIQCYDIKNFKGVLNRKIYVIVDLETLYDKNEIVKVDIKTIRDGIYKLLNRNQISNTNTMLKLLKEKNNVSDISDTIYAKKIEIENYLNQLEILLNNTNLAEAENRRKHSEFKNNYSNESGYKGLHSDIEKSHGDSKYNKEHEKIIKVKDEIIKNILTLKSKQEDIFLFLDKVLFDNTIMMDSIIKNIEMINKY